MSSRRTLSPEESLDSTPARGRGAQYMAVLKQNIANITTQPGKQRPGAHVTMNVAPFTTRCIEMPVDILTEAEVTYLLLGDIEPSQILIDQSSRSHSGSVPSIQILQLP